MEGVNRMIHEFTQPLPVLTPLGAGYALYVETSGMWENDIFTVALEADGQLRHFQTSQIRMWRNPTFDIGGNAPTT
jgi:hypothetical protein